MTVIELVELFGSGSQMIKIYDFNKCEDVWEGQNWDLPDEYEDCEVVSLDPTWDDVLTINIDTTEED